MKRHAKANALVLSALLWACGGGEAPGGDDGGTAGSSATAGPAANELSRVELEQGIGPIRDLSLAAVEPALAEEGKNAFTLKCSACHKLDERYVAPELGSVLSRRTPEFVMNMILNASEMVERHPEVRKLLAEYYTPMPVQVTEEAEARAILEYLRSMQDQAQ